MAACLFPDRLPGIEPASAAPAWLRAALPIPNSPGIASAAAWRILRPGDRGARSGLGAREQDRTRGGHRGTAPRATGPLRAVTALGAAPAGGDTGRPERPLAVRPRLAPRSGPFRRQHAGMLALLRLAAVDFRVGLTHRVHRPTHPQLRHRRIARARLLNAMGGRECHGQIVTQWLNRTSKSAI